MGKISVSSKLLIAGCILILSVLLTCSGCQTEKHKVTVSDVAGETIPIGMGSSFDVTYPIQGARLIQSQFTILPENAQLTLKYLDGPDAEIMISLYDAEQNACLMSGTIKKLGGTIKFSNLLSSTPYYIEYGISENAESAETVTFRFSN